MRSIATHFLLAITLGLPAIGCRTTGPAEEDSSLEAAGGSKTLPPAIDYFDGGFALQREKTKAEKEGKQDQCVMCKTDDDFGDHKFAVVTPEGRDLVTGADVGTTAFALDQRDVDTAYGEYVVFAWPRSSEVITRDYERLGELMTEYSKLVGTCLHRDPTGPGEKAWVKYIRWEQGQAVNKARTDGPKAWCNMVVQQLVNRFVPAGSDYLQYGNCGEGGKIGACLAMRVGFKPSETRVCYSKNDHFFAMVKDENNLKRWCILDRWDIIGNFRCDVDIDFNKRVIATAHPDGAGGVKLKPTTAEWFQNANCVTIDKYMADPNSLYNF